MRTLCLLAAAVLSSCAPPEPTSYHWTAIPSSEETGLVFDVVLAPDGTPYAQALAGIFRFDGNAFVPAQPAFPSAESPIRFAADGTIYCEGARLPPGAAAFEPLAGADQLAPRTTPTPTTSGDLYALKDGRVLYQPAGASTWTALPPEGRTFELLVPDATGGVFALTQRALYRASSGVLRYLRATVGVQAITAEGLQYRANGNYTTDYGEVIERDLDDHEVVRTDGLTCVERGAACPFNEQYPHAAFITSFQRTRSGTYFEMWAPFNAASSPRTLLRLSPGEHEWAALIATQKADGSGIDGLAIPVVDAQDRVWVWSNSQFAVVGGNGTGGYVSGTSSAVYRLDPD